VNAFRSWLSNKFLGLPLGHCLLVHVHFFVHHAEVPCEETVIPHILALRLPFARALLRTRKGIVRGSFRFR